MRQRWHDLLFAHWPVAAEALRPLVPAALQIQEFEGTSWVGVVPFTMTDIMFGELPALPWISAFAELNLRLYVEHQRKPGVWFVSLDAANPVAVWAARRRFHLPYFHAAMKVRVGDQRVHYASQRKGAAVAFKGNYGPTSTLRSAAPGSLEYFLTERYCLYTADADGRVLRGDIHHAPWALQSASAEIEENTLASAQGITLSGSPLLHFSKRTAGYGLTNFNKYGAAISNTGRSGSRRKARPFNRLSVRP
jgi:uncharacterized protein YqjF (DUF2071 family)